MGEEGRGDEGSPAYVAFTSGSTGKPKAILGSHSALSHFLPWLRERFSLGALGHPERHTLLSGLAHDPLQRDLFTALCLGGTLCVPAADDIGTPGRLAAWMARREITFTNLTPAMAQVLTEAPGGGAGIATVPTLRWAMLIGDVLTRLDVDRLRRVAPAAAVVNLYGSTETVRALGYYVVPETRGGERLREILPLGRGMEDTQLLVLRLGSGPAILAGIGEAGEICVRSPHLADGYLGDPELTREKLVINPFTGLPEDRIYRTGDLGRYLPGGDVTFAGRRDQQVKIRGFRVELGEVEAALGRLPGVREAVVVARDEEAGRRLVAYVVPSEAEPLDARDLRDRYEALRALLPAYMMPAAFVVLDRLPLTPNHKVDRRALPDPEPGARLGAREIVPPRDGVEQAIAGVWQRLLGVDAVGIHDNFFELGGHSLLGTRVIAALRDELGVEIPLRALFEKPTVESLALAVAQARVEQSADSELGALLDNLENLSDEEVEALLAADGRQA